MKEDLISRLEKAQNGFRLFSEVEPLLAEAREALIKYSEITDRYGRLVNRLFAMLDRVKDRSAGRPKFPAPDASQEGSPSDHSASS